MPNNKVTIQPLIDTTTGIFCHLLKLGSTKIVIDCGINRDFDYTIYDGIRDEIETADCILITSFDLQHIGAVGMFTKTPILCTIPTAVLGKIFLDELQATLGGKIPTTFIPKQVKYSQPIKIKDVEIVSFNAGYIIGNCLFKIARRGESVIVGYNFNHRKENFLDGLAHQAMENASILVTNTMYASVSGITALKGRDCRFDEIIARCAGTAIFSVSYQRLFELLCVLHKHEITIVSKSGRIFTERIRSMVEWAGSKATEVLSTLNLKFSKAHEITDQKIVVLVNEFFNEGYIGNVVRRLNRAGNVLVLVGQEVQEIDFSKIQVYDYSYRVKQAEIDEKLCVAQDSDGESNERHWSNQERTLFVHGSLHRRDYFPQKRRRRQNNEYGEPVTFKFEKKQVEVVEKPVREQEVEEIEDKVHVCTGIVPVLDVCSVGMPGISDYSSFKTVCKASGVGRVVLVEDVSACAQFLWAYFQMTGGLLSSSICNSATDFDVSMDSPNVTISIKTAEPVHHKFRDGSVACFRARRDGDVLECIGPCGQVVLGEIERDGLRKSLIESGFQVEISGDMMIVNDELRIKFTGNKLTMESKENGILVGVRNIVYKHVVVV